MDTNISSTSHFSWINKLGKKNGMDRDHTMTIEIENDLCEADMHRLMEKAVKILVQARIRNSLPTDDWTTIYDLHNENTTYTLNASELVKPLGKTPIDKAVSAVAKLDKAAKLALIEQLMADVG